MARKSAMKWNSFARTLHLRGRWLLVAKQHLQRFALLISRYYPARALSPRSCCILLFTLQKACYTRSVCLSPAKRLFIVVNVVFVVFLLCKASRERARWQGSFRSCGEFPLVGAVGGWPVGSPWGSSSSLTQGGWQGQRLVQTWLQEPWLQADVLLLVGP